MRPEKYDDVKNGQPVRYSINKCHLQRCCDCGLVHLVIYRIVNGMVEETVYRDDWETKRQRKKRRKK